MTGTNRFMERKPGKTATSRFGIKSKAETKEEKIKEIIDKAKEEILEILNE